MKTIEDYLINADTVPDYWAMIDIDLVADNTPFKACLEQGAASVTVGDKTFYRVGMLRGGGTGTLLTQDQFLPYFEAYGQVMLTEAEWAQYVAENTVENSEI